MRASTAVCHSKKARLAAAFGRIFFRTALEIIGLGDIIGIFVLSWLGSVVFYKFMRYDDLEVTAGAP
jgi:hypothetical protein